MNQTKPDGCAFGINAEGVVIEESLYGPPPHNSEAADRQACAQKGCSVVVIPRDNSKDISLHLVPMSEQQPLDQLMMQMARNRCKMPRLGRRRR